MSTDEATPVPPVEGEPALPFLGQTAILPLGSTEQHGPHLPSDVDTRIALAVAAEVAIRRDVVVFPALSYGASGEHQGFPGTLSIGTEALDLVLRELGRSAIPQQCSRLFIVNGHGGNSEALQSAVILLRSESRDVAWVGCRSSLDSRDTHAGHAETSVMMAIAGHLVDTESLAPGCDLELGAIARSLRQGGISAASRTGVLGDPTAATAGDGFSILERMAEETIAAFDRWRVDENGMAR